MVRHAAENDEEHEENGCCDEDQGSYAHSTTCNGAFRNCSNELIGDTYGVPPPWLVCYMFIPRAELMLERQLVIFGGCECLGGERRVRTKERKKKKRAGRP